VPDTSVPVAKLVEAVLVGGPQDGGKVHAVGGQLPQVLHVGPKWLGDGYAAWSRKPSKRFPACYVMVGFKYQFHSWRE
jgi:hypothetical protein